MVYFFDIEKCKAAGYRKHTQNRSLDSHSEQGGTEHFKEKNAIKSKKQRTKTSHGYDVQRHIRSYLRKMQEDDYELMAEKDKQN